MNPSNHKPFTGKQVKRVVIAGGGTAGWMAAAALSKVLEGVVEITLVESEEIGTIGVGEATIPTLVTFHKLLDINEQEFMAATQATIKLGIYFDEWKHLGHRYFHSFGTTGRDHWTAGFQHFWLKGRERGVAREYTDYNLESRAAELGRFSHLPNIGINYAFHLDAGAYARYLRAYSERRGLKRIEGKITRVDTDEASGFITSLVLDNGAVVEGDLFIDCTGFRALLIGQTLGVEFEDWSQWLFNDRAYAVQTTPVHDPVPYTRAIASTAGWQWRIPLQHRCGNGIVYSSRFIDDDSARQQLVSTLEGEALFEPRQIRFLPGRRLQCWTRNCVALGLSASFIEPLESTTIHLMQRGITRLLQCFPRVIQQADLDEYNKQVDDEIVHVRDFVIMHFHLNERQDTPYWVAAREMTVPATLQHRLDLFRESARVFRIPNELFAENSWIQVMMGQGIVPGPHHPVVDVMTDDQLSRFLEVIRSGVDKTANTLPTHKAYLDTYCPAPKP